MPDSRLGRRYCGGRTRQLYLNIFDCEKNSRYLAVGLVSVPAIVFDSISMSFTPSDPTAIATPTDAALSTSSSVWRRLLPLQHLGIVLLVSLPGPIAASLYSLVGGPRPTTPMQQNYRFVLGVIAEVTALILLWYVMSRQGRTWTDIGWKFGLADVFRGLALYAVVRIVEVLVWNLVQYVYMRSTGHWLVPKSLSVVSYGISFLSVAYICLAPFFEELIVRAYTMSEIMGAGGNVGVAIVVSVALQMSYHLYQGFANCIVLTVVFTAYSIYYARTRRIVPIVTAHLLMDLTFLIRRSF